jgi:hypothetical protein
MTPSRSIAIVVIALIATAALFWKMRGASGDAASPGAAPADVTTAAQPRARALATATAANAIAPAPNDAQKRWLDPVASQPLVAAAAAALPPIGAPLKDTLPILKELARSGNPVAGCRLAAQLSRCFDIVSAESSVGRHTNQAAMAPPGSDMQKIEANNVRSAENWLRELHATCDPLPKEDINNAWRFSLNAALTGHLQSIAQFTTSPPLDTTYPNRQPEGWEQYRLYAPYLMDLGSAAGERRVIEWQTRLLTGEWPHNGGYNLPPDPERALMMQMVLAKLPRSNFTSGSRGDVDRLRAQLDAAGISRATQRADEFHKNLVARRPDLKPMDGGLMGQDGLFCQEPTP